MLSGLVKQSASDSAIAAQRDCFLDLFQEPGPDCQTKQAFRVSCSHAPLIIGQLLPRVSTPSKSLLLSYTVTLSCGDRCYCKPMQWRRGWNRNGTLQHWDSEVTCPCASRVSLKRLVTSSWTWSGHTSCGVTQVASASRGSPYLRAESINSCIRLRFGATLAAFDVTVPVTAPCWSDNCY